MSATPTTLLAGIAEAALNRYLAMDPEVAARLESLQGRVLAIDLPVLATTLYLFPAAGRVQVTDAYAGEADVTLIGTPLALARLGSVGATGVDVEYRGDTALGQQFHALLMAVEFDWEEALSRVTGDVVAHQIGNLLRDAGSWGQRFADSLARNTSEYLQEESRDLPASSQVDSFLDEVDTLRADLDRMQARIERLEASRKS